MFQKGDLVVYGHSGVCQVEEIATLDMSHAQKGKLYYKLAMYHQEGGFIYSPVDSQTAKIRKVISKKDAEELIDGITEIDALWVASEKEREANYKEAIMTCNSVEWVRIIKTLYSRKKERIEQGKKITAVDDKYLKMAENNLYAELSIALGVDKNQMEAYIAQKVKENENKS